ncbi:hypothetical protein SAMN04487894_11786 [Niabella drilacis]|uniref:Uncharacterized protein n=2 Tax=Niabella drilacis (strain DSM 25811 / CCM 8410 / CCUG 62505 / LMG 26954 / E90) TaxID=1285928 RepID=A0A1G6Z828_NIADE|nr:hypothetical protein SAMN04487894_11786 [Niabella drilacis]
MTNGTNEHNSERRQAAETVAEIAPNRTLIAGLLTAAAPLKPVAVQGLQNLEMVFAQYQPAITVPMKSGDNGVIRETLHFTTLGDFAPDRLGRQSEVLRRLHFQATEYLKAARALRTDGSLKQTLRSEEERAALQETIKNMMALLGPYL